MNLTIKVIRKEKTSPTMAVPEGGMIVIERGSVNSKQWGFHDFIFIFDTDYCVCYLKILILMYMLLLYVSIIAGIGLIEIFHMFKCE